MELREVGERHFCESESETQPSTTRRGIARHYVSPQYPRPARRPGRPTTPAEHSKSMHWQSEFHQGMNGGGRVDGEANEEATISIHRWLHFK